MNKGKRQSKSQIAPSWKFWYVLLQLIVYLPVKIVFGLQIFREPRLRGLLKQAPAIIIAPHQNFLDAVFMTYAVGIGVPMRFVATDLLLRNKLGRWFVRHTGCIPITQFSSDTGAVRNLLQAIRNRQHIAIFPEGERSLDGRHVLPRNSLLRIFKRAGVNIIGVELTGAYLSWPRWSTVGFGRGKIIAQSRLLVTAEELQYLDEDALAERLEPLFANDDYQVQQQRLAQGKKPYKYNKRRQPAGLENLIHRCPHCSYFQSMEAGDGIIKCCQCKMEYQLDSSGLLYDAQNNLYVSPAEWHREQIAKTYDFFQEGIPRPCKAYSYHPTADHNLESDPPLTGELILEPTGKLYFKSTEGEPLTIDLEPKSLVYRLNQDSYIQFSTKEKERYRFIFTPVSSITLYIDYLLAMKEVTCKKDMK